MNFFGLQDVAERDSLILLGVFTVAMAVFGWVVNKVTLFFTFIVSLMYPSLGLGHLQVVMVGLMWSYILFKCYTRHRDINYGGGSLAESFGAKRIKTNELTGRERELLNVVEEMSIASSLNVPPLYVLRNEPGINAFVLGKQDQPAMVVTQGVIDHLQRDEMSAVVAHEFAHIANNDLKLNMRMLVVLGGLNSIRDLGSYSIGDNIDSRMDIKQVPHEVNPSIIKNLFLSPAFAMFFSAIFWLLGVTLVFFGNVMKAWFSRKRELLADAKAVQYTRNTWGLASVLDKVSDDPTRPALRSKYSGELEHLCLSGPWENCLFLVNHPAPESRIALLEPHYEVRKRSREYREEAEKSAQIPSAENSSMSVGSAIDAKPVQQFENEIALVLSIMITTSGYNDVNSQSSFRNAMRCYTSNDVPMRSKLEPGIAEEFDQALISLQDQSPAQKNAFLEHLKEIMQHDGIHTPEEKNMLDLISIRLNPTRKAA